jgi:hypothetical protein
MRRFTHYVLLSWAFTLGAMAFTGIGYMIFLLVTGQIADVHIACAICD